MSSPNEEKYPPACDICGGGEVIDGLVVWGLDDPKLDEHANHDVSRVWDHTANRGRGAWVPRDSAAGQRVLNPSLAKASKGR